MGLKKLDILNHPSLAEEGSSFVPLIRLIRPPPQELGHTLPPPAFATETEKSDGEESELISSSTAGKLESFILLPGIRIFVIPIISFNF